MNPFRNLSAVDQARLEFLVVIEGHAEELELTEWERSFIADLVDNPRGLDAAQIDYVAALRAKYEPRLRGGVRAE